MQYVGSQFPDQQSNLHPLYRKCGVLTSGHQGSPQEDICFAFYFQEKTNTGVVKDMEVDRSRKVVCLLDLIKLIW